MPLDIDLNVFGDEVVGLVIALVVTVFQLIEALLESGQRIVIIVFNARACP
jgi:hypothetical protein